MKLTKVLCLFLLLAVACSFTACDILAGLMGDNTPAEPTKFTVEFDSNGGSAVESQSVEKDQLATKPADPTKEGYEFLGWFLDGVEWDFAKNKVTKAITLIAEWEKIDDPVPPAPTEYTITYMDGENVLSLTPDKYTSESTDLELPVAPAKDHYVFVGWYSDASFGTEVVEIDVNAGKNITLYAKYQLKSYKINYNLDGGVNAETNPAEYTIEDLPVTLADPTKEGYKFLGWYKEYNFVNEIEGVTLETAGNLDIYAKWERIPETYTITYLAPDGSVLALEPATYQEGSTSDIALPDYDCGEDFDFLGWTNVDTNETGLHYIKAGSTGNITLQAVVDQNAFTFTYYIDGVEYKNVKFKDADGVPTLLDPTKAGYNFSGWTHLGSSIPVTSIPANGGKDVALYGTYTAIDYTITYVVDDVNVPLTPSTYQVSETAIALPELPAKAGYKALGWYNEAGDKVVEIKAGEIGDLVLTAKYEVLVYTVTFVNGDVTTTVTFEHGSIPTLENPANREGYLFKGWYDEAGNLVSELTNADITLTAKWVPYKTSDGSSTVTPEVPLG